MLLLPSRKLVGLIMLMTKVKFKYITGPIRQLRHSKDSKMKSFLIPKKEHYQEIISKWNRIERVLVEYSITIPVMSQRFCD